MSAVAAMLVAESVVIRVEKLERQKAFWAAALAYIVREAHDESVLLHSRGGCGPNVPFGVMPSERTLSPRINLVLDAQVNPQR